MKADSRIYFRFFIISIAAVLSFFDDFPYDSWPLTFIVLDFLDTSKLLTFLAIVLYNLPNNPDFELIFLIDLLFLLFFFESINIFSNSYLSN